jgi:phospholipid/cholesterol/gamma-HCH transport system substrate-binding protein
MRVPRSRLGSYLALATFLASAAAVFLWLFHTAGGSLGIAAQYRVWATLPDAFALNPGADVTAAGVRIGRVGTIKPDGRHASVQLQIDKRYAPLPRSTTLSLQTKSLVGENYIALQLGSPRDGYEPSGGVLPASAGLETVALDQVLDALTPGTRRAVTADLRSLGMAVGQRGEDINRSLANLGAISDNGSPVLATLAAQAPQVYGLVATSRRLFDALSLREDALRGLIVYAGDAASAAASRDRQLRQTLRLLPATLNVLRTTSTTLGALGRAGSPVISDLSIAVRRLTPAVQLLPSSTSAGIAFSTHLPVLASGLSSILGDLRRFSVQTRPVAAPLRGALQQLLPFATYIRPFAADLGGWFATVGNAGGWFDSIGHMLAVQMLFDEQTLASLPPSAAQFIDRLKAMSPIAAIGRTWANPYPAPGTAGNSQPLTGPPARVGGPSQPSRRTR